MEFEKEIPMKLGASFEQHAKTKRGVRGLGRNCKWWDWMKK